jgi:uncharacterized FlaG/YvyC family protein
MSDNPLSQLRGADYDLAGRYNRAEYAQAPQVSGAQSAGQTGDEPGAAQAAKPEANAERMKNPLSSVYLKFKVDSKTNDVTVLVLDKASRKVLRTIPPEEMTKLQAGDLLDLFS